MSSLCYPCDYRFYFSSCLPILLSFQSFCLFFSNFIFICLFVLFNKKKWRTIYKLHIHHHHYKLDEQWEKDLEAELQDYEVVNDDNNQNINWEKDVEDLLDESNDLK